jgi:hypothetical protein
MRGRLGNKLPTDGGDTVEYYIKYYAAQSQSDNQGRGAEKNKKQ